MGTTPDRFAVDDEAPAAEEKSDQLARVLSEFARTLLTDFSIQEILDHLVVRIVEALPVSGAGVSLITPGRPPRYVAASSAAALDYERLQTTLGQGPCMQAFETGVIVASPDLQVETRFPEFTRAALGVGLRAVFSAPLHHSSGRIGALDLYRDSPGPLSARDLVSVQTLADVAAAYVLNAEAREEARTSAELFRASSLHDPLTGLPNRTLMIQRLTHAAQRAQRDRTFAAVLFVDLDGFKKVNDEHGHDVGDQLLVAVAARLQALVGPGDTVARLSGDEFLLLHEDLTDPTAPESLAARVSEVLALPFSLPHADIAVTASVGLACSEPGQVFGVGLIREADTAMYVAKRDRTAHPAGPDVGPDTGADAGPEGGLGRARGRRTGPETDDLLDDLRTAVAARSLHLAYQPVVRVADGVVVGVETLLRWDHPVRGPVPAPRTVALAEHAGLIDELGEWIVRRSCQDRAGWPVAEGHDPLELAVNVSAVQLLDPGLARTVEDVLTELSVDPASLVVEVTETILIQDGPRALVVLESLRKLGVQIALDDFGTGYSSLTHLHRFPVDVVKIDRSFVERITVDDAAAAIVRAVTNLAHELGMRVVAEGAQTQRQVARLAEMGCDAAQGFYFARPMSATQVGLLLRDQPSSTALPAR